MSCNINTNAQKLVDFVACDWTEGFKAKGMYFGYTFRVLEVWPGMFRKEKVNEANQLLENNIGLYLIALFSKKSYFLKPNDLKALEVKGCTDFRFVFSWTESTQI